MLGIILQTVGNTGVNFNLLYVLFIALIGLIVYYLALRFGWLKTINLTDRRNLTEEINDDIPRFIIINNELQQILSSSKIKEYSGSGWSRKLIIRNNNTNQVNDNFIIRKEEVQPDNDSDEMWNGVSIIFKYNKDGFVKDGEKDRIIEQQNLKIASLTEELKIANAGVEVQMRKRIKEQAIARSAGTSLGYPSSDRQMPDERDI